MLRQLSLLLCLGFAFQLNAQNLIPNPSFEDVNVCKTYGEECSPSAWRAAELKCFLYYEHLKGKPEEAKPKDGSRYIALRVFNRQRAEDRSFAQAPLLCPLQGGVSYELSFFIYAQAFMVKQLGVLFSDSLTIYKKNKTLLQKTKYLQIPFPDPVPSREWTQVNLQFIATGKEKAIMIGNFLPDSLTEVQKIVKTKKRLPNRIYYSFDDFQLKPLQDSTIQCDLAFSQQQIYKDSIRHIRAHRPVLATFRPSLPIPKPELDTVPAPAPIVQPGSPIVTEQVFVLKNLQFEFNRSEIRSSSFAALDSLSHYLTTKPETYLEITGHTDNIGNQLANLKLSKARALAVRNYLINRGIAQRRVRATGKGALEPIADNRTEQGRAINRRVEFLIE